MDSLIIIEIVSNFPLVHAAIIHTTAHSFRSSHSIAVFREAIAAEQIVLMPSDALPKFSAEVRPQRIVTRFDLGAA